MRIGVLKEIKPDEYRISLTPAGTREITSRGHTVLVERAAGAGSSFSDEAYVAAGARIAPDAEAVFAQAELLLKVKEPLEPEYRRLRPEHTLFTYLHLAPAPDLTRGLIESGATCLGYETVQTANGHLPLLSPMSEVAGRLAPQAAANVIERVHGGKGKLLGGVAGVAPARVVVLGAGIAGANAATIASGMRAHVIALDLNHERLMDIQKYLPAVEPLMSNTLTIEEQVAQADVLIGAVLIPGALAPRLVTEEMVMTMQPGSVIVDISIDQGGCVATSRPTTHSHPTFVEHGVVHYCVTNMPGAVPITSTLALTNATLPYILRLADQGLPAAARADPALARGINVMEGKVTNLQVAQGTGEAYFPLDSLLPVEYT